MINNWQDFCEAFVSDRDASEATVEKWIFKGTECGSCFRKFDDGIRFAGYAKGADAECSEHVMTYPFDMQDFWVELQEADNEGVELWHEWNVEQTCIDWAESGGH